MHALMLSVALAAAPQNAGQVTRDIVVGVCLPFVASGEPPADAIARTGLRPRADAGPTDYQTLTGRHLVKLTVTGDAGEGTLRRVCEVQARSDSFAEARDAVKGPLEQAGFAPAPDEPEDWPVWTRGGVTATVHQNPGRATIVRVSYSILDDEAS